MSQYYNIVAWFDRKEWCDVYEKLYSQPSTLANKQDALKQLFIWKARCPSLPSGIESTLSLLEVQIEDERATDDALNQQVLRLAYSSAVMRFVNHMLDSELAKGLSLYQAAHTLNVPDWIIDLRHETAHSNNLPSIELLREAAKFGLQWLQKTYWEQQRRLIKDYVVGDKQVVTGENKITSLMDFCLSLSICAHSQCEITNLAQIPDDDMRASLQNDIKLFFHGFDLSNLNAISIKTLIGMVNAQSKRLLKGKNTSVFVNSALLGEDSLFLSAAFVDIMGENKHIKKNQLSKHFMQCFEVLLTFLHSNDLLLDFILELISITKQEEAEHERRKLAAIWISELLKALKRCQIFNEKKILCDLEAKLCKNKADLVALFFHWFPKEKVCKLLLDIEKGVPHELTQMKYIQPIISSYNPYLIYFIRDLLNLLRNGIPKETVHKICALAELISKTGQFTDALSKCPIYTVEDLQPSNDVTIVDSDSDCTQVIEECNVSLDKTQDPQPNSIWKLASINHNWSSCPIGLLPWQQRNAAEDMDVDC